MTNETDSELPGNAGVIAPPPLVYLAALGVGFKLNKWIGRGSLPLTVRLPVGAAALVGGGALMRSFVQAFQRADTPLDPYKASKVIVTDGPYRLSRNPGYLGMSLVYCGISILANAPVALVPLPLAVAVIDRGVIDREEIYLERKFGESYLEYKRRVRRWI